MKTIFIRLSGLLLTVALMIAAGTAPAVSQTLLEEAEKMAFVDTVSGSWTSWESLSVSGKFKMGGLPVSPSVKIFMQRDSSILISLRAPFVGEVGRAEIVDSTLLVVNKMNKTYVEEPIAKALAYYPGGISDIQDLLLGRAVIPGLGLLSPDIAGSVEIYAEDDGSTTLIASEEARLEGFNYGYSFTPEYLLGALMVLPLSRPDVAVTLTYQYYTKGYDIEFVYQSEKRNYRALLELDTPDPEGNGFGRIKLGNKYTKLPFDKFIKSF